MIVNWGGFSMIFLIAKTVLIIIYNYILLCQLFSMNNYKEGKLYLGQIWIDITKITKDIGDYIFQSLDYGNINVDNIKLFAAPQTPPEVILGVLWLDTKYFEWKKVLDIWWWFGWMPFILEKYVNHYIVCDPCLAAEIKNASIERALVSQEFIIAFNQWALNERTKELEKLELNKMMWSPEYKETIKLVNFSSEFLEKKKSVLNYINMWNEFNQKQHENIILNDSRWEDIQWIENNSQDIVLICHILDKDYVNYNWILAEASRILTPDWEILVVEDKDQEMIDILKKLWIQREEKWGKIICRIKKY